MLLAFALAYCVKDAQELSFHVFLVHFNEQYRALHGNFSEEILPEESVFDFTLFFGLTMLQPLILMNLLIAIIAVAHGRIEDARHRVSYHQLNAMVLENEIFMPWNRDKNERGHLVTAQYENDDSVSW
jgi:ABC-type taurine transport system ATPase subunit